MREATEGESGVAMAIQVLGDVDDVDDVEQMMNIETFITSQHRRNDLTQRKFYAIAKKSSAHNVPRVGRAF